MPVTLLNDEESFFYPLLRYLDLAIFTDDYKRILRRSMDPLVKPEDDLGIPVGIPDMVFRGQYTYLLQAIDLK